MDRRARVATAESVAFDFELAGIGSRAAAVVIDTAIQIAAIVALSIAASLIAGALHAKAPGLIARIPIGKLSHATLVAIYVFAVFAIFEGYFILFEWRMHGATPGKRLLHLRVVRDGGFPLDLTASVVRNVVRVLEATFAFYLFSAICALLSPFNRRIGDYAAGTIVVRSGRYERATLPIAHEPSSDPLIASLTPAECDLVRRYLAREASMAPPERHDLATRVAEIVRPKLPASFDHLSSEELLAHVGRVL